MAAKLKCGVGIVFSDPPGCSAYLILHLYKKTDEESARTMNVLDLIER